MPTTAAENTELYATLHREIESGERSETKWARLAAVCIELDKKDEALGAFANVTAYGLRRDLQRRLADRGWLGREAAKNVTGTDADLSPAVWEKLADGVQLLLERKVRKAVVAGTVAFPVLLVLGGMLTALADSFALRLLAAVPPLFVVGLVIAFGRHLLVHSVRADADPHDLPELRSLVRQAPRALGDCFALALPFLAPAGIVSLLGEPVLAMLLLLPAVFLMPMATALRLLGNDWRALTPRRVVAAARGCPTYFATTRVLALVFAPAMAAFVVAMGKPAFLIVSVVGPLAVAPLFVAIHMVGTTLHYERAGVPAGFTFPKGCFPERGRHARAGVGQPQPMPDA